MSACKLRLIVGPSGAGKSTYLHRELIERSRPEPEKEFLILVPDQFTMQTQMDVVRAHPDHGIMNIDVLSFNRLFHRVFDEVGEVPEGILDDTGKTLILRLLAARHKASLPVIGKNFQKSGFIDEVKSTISEFLQYGVSPAAVKELSKKSESRPVLSMKLKELGILYETFLAYIHGNYLTTEERMDVLCDALPRAKFVRGSVVALDGFTGFTPIQYRVLRTLMSLCDEVIVTVTGEEVAASQAADEQSLFRLSDKTMRELLRISFEAQTGQDAYRAAEAFQLWQRKRSDSGQDIVLTERPVWRLKDAPVLAHLEAQLFRYKTMPYKEDPSPGLSFFEASTPKQEVRAVLAKIKMLVRTTGCCYRDIAVIAGNFERYADEVEAQARRFDIPVYLDRTNTASMNPVIEFLRCAVRLYATGLKRETVFPFLKCALTDFTREETDALETYALAYGIDYRKDWMNDFVRGEGADEIAAMEELRKRFLQMIAPLEALQGSRFSAKEITDALLTLIRQNDTEEKLLVFAGRFAEVGDAVREKEYRGIYGKAEHLLEDIRDLLGTEEMTWKEYAQILDAGLSSIEVGTIPLNVDRVVVGDMERTRLREVKHLFFLGVTDAAIPGNRSGGGFLSDIERQFLSETVPEIELAPTPRELMYIQRLYLYMNLTKPSGTLTLSCPKVDFEGKSVREAYLIAKIRALFPALQTSLPEAEPLANRIATLTDGIPEIATQLRSFADGRLGKEEEEAFLALYLFFRKELPNEIAGLTDAAFSRYKAHPLPAALAAALYGQTLYASVSRMELFASCCYAHFARYGLRLAERQEYEFEVSDLGNVFHGVLESFGGRLADEGLDWAHVTAEDKERLLDDAMRSFAEVYNGGILLRTARGTKALHRIRRILARSVDTLQYQLQKGSFTPAHLELSFQEAGMSDPIDIGLTTKEQEDIKGRLKLSGRIDRMDLYEDADHVYVKVIDFKSGKRSFDIAALYYGLQLQLILYMNVAETFEKTNHPDKEIVPAAVLYYRVADPVVKFASPADDHAVQDALNEALKTTGLVNEKEGVAELLDHDLKEGALSSDILPLRLKKDGGFTATSAVISEPEYRLLSGHVNRLIAENGRKILSGEIAVNPYELEKRNACAYCAYRAICKLDAAIPGYAMRSLQKMNREDVLDELKREERE